ncbi:MAG: hypothetical protein HY614_11435, partial [Candidatus Rokubacteria bacterium]|nr:hypothetical protein [Candidatus Rokubacteria bacterium]
MRRVWGMFVAVAVVLSLVAFFGGPPRATAQGGGSIEVEVKYDGAPVVETIKINKDVEQCGQEQKIEKVVV